MSLERLLLWRHGRTAWNSLGRFQGQQDTPLDEVGIAQAQRAAPYLAIERPTAIYASDLDRAAATGRVLGELLSLPVHTDPRLRETSLGAWEGLDRAGVAERFPDEFAAWTGGAKSNPGNGEQATEVAQRARELVDELVEREHGTVVLAAHGGSLKALTTSLIGMPEDIWSLLAPLRNCHWSELRRTEAGAWRLQAHNVFPLDDPRTLISEELNVDSDAGDDRITRTP